MEGNWNGKDGANKYQHNNKEWNDDFGLGWSHYGARLYDAAAARWWHVDPLAEKYNRLSPYNYCANNPVRSMDPDGKKIFILNTNTEALIDLAFDVLKEESEGEAKLTLGDSDDNGYREVTITGTGKHAKELAKVSASKEKYLYMVSDTYQGTNRTTNKRESGKMTKEALNYSRNPRGDYNSQLERYIGSSRRAYQKENLSNSAIEKLLAPLIAAFKENYDSQFDLAPISGFAGQVIVQKSASDKAIYEMQGMTIKVSRYYFGIHELLEVYYRTEQGMTLEAAHEKVKDEHDKTYEDPDIPFFNNR